jgi:radical SAM family uncharacterized protein/radical SAM-linked protein
VSTDRSITEHPYSQFLDRVHKPGRYTGGEQGAVRKDWNAASCRMCLAFPDVYEIGMSHLGYKILYDIVNAEPGLIAERAYAVWHDMEAELRSHQVLLRSLESGRELREFDIVGFSLQYELTYTNILQMLDLGGVPVLGRDRTDSDPLVVAGGPTATHAEPMSQFIDAFLIGDGERKTVELMQAWASMRDEGLPRRERLRRIAQLGGFYVPSLYETKEDAATGFHLVEAADPIAPMPVQREIVQDLNDFPFPVEGPVANCETVFDRASIEIARGCTEGCRFCQAGMIYRPVRERDPQDIVDTMIRSVTEAGYDEASLTSLSTADYSAIAPLVHQSVQALSAHRVSLSVSSLRAYGLSEQVLDDLKKQRAGGLTFAPEAGTQRMRDVVNKNVTDAQLMETAERVFSRGWTKMKLYFMIGLPTEEDEDIRGIVETGARALQVARRIQKNKRARVTVSVSTHVPKPHTPFQWCAMDSQRDVLRKQALLRETADGTHIQLKMHSAAGSWLEGALARGDRRLGEVILGAYRRGARFDSWDEQLDLSVWNEAFEEAGIDPQLFLGTIPVTARLPWSHIDVSLAEGFLAREYRKALRNRLSPPCGKAVGNFVHHTNVAEAEADPRRLVCYDCGVACDLTQMREERLVFLKRMDALEPIPKTQSSESADSAEKTEVTDRRPFRDVDQGPSIRVRVGYRKLGRVAYTSHLDLVRSFPRILRRAGLPLHYTEGFHPKPQLTFGPALAVGTSSLAEYLDIRLREREQPELEGLCDRLNAVALEGMEFFGHAVLGPHDQALNRVLEEVEYVAALPRRLLPELGVSNETALHERLEAGTQHDDLFVWRSIHGIKKRVDVSAALIDTQVGEGGTSLTAAGLVGDLIPVRIRLRLGGSTTPRPVEVLRALTGAGSVDARIVRVGFHAQRCSGAVTPLALDALRDKSAMRVAV